MRLEELALGKRQRASSAPRGAGEQEEDQDVPREKQRLCGFGAEPGTEFQPGIPHRPASLLSSTPRQLLYFPGNVDLGMVTNLPTLCLPLAQGEFSSCF